MTNPTGRADPRRAPTQPALDDDLMARVLASANLKLAWKQVKANQGAAGVDGMSIDAFPSFAREHWPSLREALLNGTYQPSPLRQQSIPKPDGRGPTDQLSFLGFSLRGTKLCWSEKTSVRFRREVRRLTNRNWGVSMSRRMTELGRYLRGWMGHFWISEYYRPLPEIDQWIRRRVRMCYWVQWRRARTRIGHLLKMGVPKGHAVLTGRSSRGPWHPARTEATQLAMSNRWLAQQGLVSVKDLWISFNYPR